jgi:hypothetical protein
VGPRHLPIITSLDLMTTVILLGAAAPPVLAQEEIAPICRRAVGAWRVEYAPEGDGGLMVRLSRSDRAWPLELYESYWRGNGGVMMATHLRRSGPDCGAEWRESWATGIGSAKVRARFETALRQCGASPAEARSVMAGFEPAYALTAAWANHANLATKAEIDAIVAYGSDARAERAAQARQRKHRSKAICGPRSRGR